MHDQLDQVPQMMDTEDRPGQRRGVVLSDPVFYAGCFALALLPETFGKSLDFVEE